VTVAALFVQARGCYYGLDDVDPWGEGRDARLYAGPWPVIAHPPCAIAGLEEARRTIVWLETHGAELRAALAAPKGP
jgi:hypothetical protein